MKYLGNAFSLGMVAPGNVKIISIDIDAKDVPTDCKSVVGHADTAAILTNLLGFEVPYNRESVSLQPEDVMYVAQVVGPRLPEGTTVLPEGSKMSFKRITYTMITEDEHTCNCGNACGCGHCRSDK